MGAPTVLDVLDGLAVEPEFDGPDTNGTSLSHDRGYLCDEAGADPYTGAVSIRQAAM